MSCFLCVIFVFTYCLSRFFQGKKKKKGRKGGEGTRAEQSVGDFGEFQVFYKAVVDVYFNPGDESVSVTPYHIEQLRTRVGKI